MVGLADLAFWLSSPVTTRLSPEIDFRPVLLDGLDIWAWRVRFRLRRLRL